MFDINSKENIHSKTFYHSLRFEQLLVVQQVFYFLSSTEENVEDMKLHRAQLEYKEVYNRDCFNDLKHQW